MRGPVESTTQLALVQLAIEHLPQNPTSNHPVALEIRIDPRVMQPYVSYQHLPREMMAATLFKKPHSRSRNTLDECLDPDKHRATKRVERGRYSVGAEIFHCHRHNAQPVEQVSIRFSLRVTGGEQFVAVKNGIRASKKTQRLHLVGHSFTTC